MRLLLPIKTTILHACGQKDEPSGVCPDCEQDGQGKLDPRWEAVVDGIRKAVHSEEEAREIEPRMMDMARGMFRLPRTDRPRKDH